VLEHAYLLAPEEGEVEVRRHGERVATLSGGCVVGERGVVLNALRTADVRATSAVSALYFPMDRVRPLRRDVPDIDEHLRGLIEQRED
jgi:CRP-like cAMP-binding protein